MTSLEKTKTYHTIFSALLGSEPVWFWSRINYTFGPKSKRPFCIITPSYQISRKDASQTRQHEINVSRCDQSNSTSLANNASSALEPLCDAKRCCVLVTIPSVWLTRRAICRPKTPELHPMTSASVLCVRSQQLLRQFKLRLKWLDTLFSLILDSVLGWTATTQVRHGRDDGCITAGMQGRFLHQTRVFLRVRIQNIDSAQDGRVVGAIRHAWVEVDQIFRAVVGPQLVLLQARTHRNTQTLVNQAQVAQRI